jgi:hypothetical protein
MTRSPRAVNPAARRVIASMLASIVVACWIDSAAIAAQDRQQFPPGTGGQTDLIARHSSSAIRVHIDEDSAAPQFDNVRLPANLVVAAPLRQTLESMLRDSPTFRRQCARIASAASLVVTVERVIIPAGARSLAVTAVRSDADGRMSADVRLGQSGDREELIAHEFEHVIEQLDGVDLLSLARDATAGVRFTEDADRFETERAVAMGRQVAHEIRTARRKHM